MDTLAQMNDVKFTSLVDGNIIKYDSVLNKWINTITHEYISTLLDVQFTNLVDKNIIQYDSGSGTWKNSANNQDLVNLTDVELGTLVNNDVLTYDVNIQKWINKSAAGIVTLGTLTDVQLFALAVNDVLKYDTTSSTWTSGKVNMEELGNVEITDLMNNQILVYDQTSGKWKNSLTNQSSGSLVLQLTALVENDMLVYNGSAWINRPHNLSNVGGVALSAPVIGNVLTFDGVNWSNQPPNHGILQDITDVTITAPTSGQTLNFDATSNTWKNQNVAGATFPALVELTDVVAPVLKSGDMLVYRDQQGMQNWIPTNTKITPFKMPKLSNQKCISRTEFFIYDGQVFTMGSGEFGLSGLYTELIPNVRLIGYAPIGDDEIVEIVYGWNSVLALSKFGRVFEWGSRSTAYSSPNHIPEEIIIPGGTIRNLWTTSSTVPLSNDGISHFAIDFNNNVWGWGTAKGNEFGGLGLGSVNVAVPQPTKIQFPSGTEIAYLAFSDGNRYSAFAIDTIGRLFAWGRVGDNGNALGLGSLPNSNVLTPTLVPGISGVVNVVSFGEFDGISQRTSTIALKNDGTVWSSGNNINGELGIGTLTSSGDFIQESTGSTNNINVFGGPSLNGGIAAIIKSDGTMRLAGHAINGCFGDGLPDGARPNFLNSDQFMNAGFQGYMAYLMGDKFMPKVLIKTSISSGECSIHILDNRGILWACGSNQYGRLGIGSEAAEQNTFVQCPTPNFEKIVNAKILGLTNDAPGILAITESGRLISCGGNNTGSHGNSLNLAQANSPFFKYVMGFGANNAV
jgi:alpha-tubulin suppressor-like RCC1 family protein